MDTEALRKKILDLAICGKLVPQDPNDEPASALLEKIRAEKQNMVKEGKLKPKDIRNDTIIFKGEDNLHYEKFQDGTVKCIEDEIPFDVPEGWEWCRLSQVIILYSGQDLEPSRYNDNSIGIPYITGASNFEDGHILINRWTDSPTTHATIDDLLLTCKGSGVGKMVWCNIEDAHIARQIMALRCANGLYKNYLEIVILAFLSKIVSKANGLIPGLSRDVILNMTFPLPPINEQTQIYHKSKEILSCVEQVEKEREKLIDIINITKSKILDLAIRGQLVPQDPNDEPASVLLERIRAEKEELIKQGKIKRDKKESVIFKGEDNSYYDNIPDNWAECSILSIAEVELGKTLDKAKNTGTYYPYLRSVNIKWDDVDLTDVKEMKFEENELTRYSVKKNDLLICEGGDVGRCCIWNAEQDIYYQNALHRVRFYGNCHPKYFLYIMMYLESMGYLKRISNGVTIKHLTKNVLASIPFLLPSLAEQKRIVEAIEDIFSKLDAITENIS